MVTKKILLIELKNNNLGDSIIADTCEYIIKSINQHVSISRIGLFPPKSIMKNFKKYLPFKAYNFLIEKTKHKYIQHILEFIKWHRFTKKNKPAYKYYYDAISASDIVIVAGGGLIKYSREDLWNPIYTITKICSENNIPIIYDTSNYIFNIKRFSLEISYRVSLCSSNIKHFICINISAMFRNFYILLCRKACNIFVYE